MPKGAGFSKRVCLFFYNQGLLSKLEVDGCSGVVGSLKVGELISWELTDALGELGVGEFLKSNSPQGLSSFICNLTVCSLNSNIQIPTVI